MAQSPRSRRRALQVATQYGLVGGVLTLLQRYSSRILHTRRLGGTLFKSGNNHTHCLRKRTYSCILFYSTRHFRFLNNRLLIGTLNFYFHAYIRRRAQILHLGNNLEYIWHICAYVDSCFSVLLFRKSNQSGLKVH